MSPLIHTVLAIGSARQDIANYVSALFEVYILLIFIYILLNMMFSLGVRPPYNRWTDVILGFLRDVCDPYLAIFRRFIPPLGMLDLSPIVGIFVLIIVDRIVVSAIG
jgi:YggT family protein